MTPEQIVAAIKADPTLTALALDGSDGEIARTIAPESRPKSFKLTSAAILQLFNRSGAPHAGGVLLGKLRVLATEATPVGANTAEILRLLDGVGWELMDNATPDILQAWQTANVLNAAQITAIRELAMESVRPTHQEISKALRPFRPDGKVGQLVGI